MPALAAIPWLGTAIAGAAGAGGAIIAGKMQSGAASDAAKLQTDAANHSADTLDAAAQRAEAFQRQQAEQQWQASQQTQKANYDQARARFSTIAGVGAQYGLPGMTMPDYAPGVDPHYDTSTAPLPGAGTTPNAAGTVAGATGTAPPVDGSPASISAYFKSKGVSDTETPYWVSKWPELVARGQQLNDPNYAMKRLSQADIFGGGAGTIAGAAKPGNPYAMTAPVLAAPQVTTGIPTPYQPGTIASYAGRRY